MRKENTIFSIECSSLSDDRVDEILKLMSVDLSADKTTLYVEVVLKVACEMAMEGPTFTYSEFRSRLDRIRWAPGQETPLTMRLELVDSFIAPSAANTAKSRPAQAQENIWAFSPGSLTIIDLSDPR
ncbi:hypothetical protein F5Y04DRAFT_289347 [Hypomontagnella monticulosa]|nr:hypothetical protein F5Y04DRAFT_289347 [Hypomontagnella monticulosa]